MNVITTNPKAVTLGIGLAITLVIGSIIGLIDDSQALANEIQVTGPGIIQNFQAG